MQYLTYHGLRALWCDDRNNAPTADVACRRNIFNFRIHTHNVVYDHSLTDLCKQQQKRCAFRNIIVLREPSLVLSECPINPNNKRYSLGKTLHFKLA